MNEAGTPAPELLARIQAEPAAERRVLIRGAAVVSMDDAIGDLPRGDVLIEGTRIAAVGPDLGTAAADGQALVIAAEGAIAIPGLQDTHRHSWQTQLRRMFCDGALADYIGVVHGEMGPVFRPRDIYLGTRLAALTALQSGITSVLDFSHNRRTTEHGDAAVGAWAESGVRATIVPVRPLFGAWDHRWEEDLRSLRDGAFASDDQLLRLRVGAYARSVPALVTGEIELTAATAQLARELGLGVTVDAVFGAGASDHLIALAAEGVLSPAMTFIHCQSIADAAWDGLAEAGCRVALAATSDAQLGCEDSLPPIQQALDRGIAPGLSIDVECCLSSDIYTQMRFVLSVQRMLAHQRHHHGDAAAPAPLPVREALRYATIAGAEANGVADISGSLTPGKAADVVLIRGDDIDNLPLSDAVATVVLGTDAGNVETVLVDGVPRKWDRRLVDVDVPALRREVEASRDWLLQQVGRSIDGAEAPVRA
jgi:cytosine/adenosine deaminase-related metal-dependent hydrolase